MSGPVSPAPTPAPAAPSAAGALPPTGSLAQHPPLHLYYLAASGEVTGRLVLEIPERTLTVHFRKGMPDFIDSTHPDDALGSWLVRAQVLTPAQLAQAEAARPQFGGELLGALFGLSLLPPAHAFAQLSQRASELLLRGLMAESGRFSFGAGELPAHKALPLGDRWGVLSALMRRVPGPELRRRLMPVLEQPVMKSGGRVDPTQLRLTPQETRTLGRIDGVRSLAQLLQEAPLEAETLLRLVYLLRALEALTFLPPRPAPAPRATPPPPPAAAVARPAAPAARPPAPGAPPVLTPPGSAAPPSGRHPTVPPVLTAAATASPTPARPTPVPPGVLRPPAPAQAPPARPTPVPPGAVRPAGTPTRPPPAAATPSEDVPALRTLLETLKGQNHFERLGVPESADGGAVKVAYFRLARQYHPDTVPPGAPPELGKVKADLFALIGEAYRALSEDASRASYLQELKSGGGGEVDVLGILKAEELFRRACVQVKGRRFAEALKLLDEAVALHPEEGEFYAWRGFARFFLVPDKAQGRTEATRDLQEALKRNERCVEAHFFLGQVCKLSGDATAALRHFKRAVELKPEHIDAAREVRLMTGKK